MKLILSIILCLLLLLIMANNIPHGAELYAKISERTNATIEPIWQGYFVMGLFDVGVLVMLFCGDVAVSIALSVLLFMANIFFWNVPEEIKYWHLLAIYAQTLVVWKIALSGMFSFLLHRISETLRNFMRQLRLAKRIRARLSLTSRDSAESEQNKKRDGAFNCETCQRSFASQNALNAHKCKGR